VWDVEGELASSLDDVEECHRVYSKGFALTGRY
jgi:hypothetical protein